MGFDLQSVIAVGLLILVIAYITSRYIVKPMMKSEKHNDNCGPGCSCNP